MATEEPSPTSHGQTTTIRISRGATVMGTDGALGAVRQIIMDQHTGELQALVIATDDTHQVELPATHVLRATGDTVNVDINMADLRAHPDLARPYNPDQYVPVHENPILPPSEASRGATFSERPVVTTVEHDAVGVVVPRPSTQTAAMIASMTTPEAERYIPQPQPVPAPPATPADTTTQATQSTAASATEAGYTEVRAGSVLPPSSLTPTAPLIERPEIEHRPASADDTTKTHADSPDEATAAIPDTTPKAVVDEIDELNANAAEPVAMPAEPSSDAPPESSPDSDLGAMSAPVDATDTADTGEALDDFTEPEAMLAEDSGDLDDDQAFTTRLTPIITPGAQLMESAESARADADESATLALESSSTGLENATTSPDVGTDAPTDAVNAVEEDGEEAAFMEGTPPPVNPVNPGAGSDTIHDEDNISTIFGESQQSYTTPPPPEMAQRGWGRQRLVASSSEETGNQLSWAPAAALGVVIVGIAAWSTYRAIRRGRRKAAEAAQNARISAESLRATVRDSVRDAGKSAVELAQTVRASAQEIAASPRDTATDAFSNFSDIPARYRWFRRGVRVGARAARFRRR